MKKRLKKIALPSIYILIILVTFFSVSIINNHLLKNVTNYDYSKSIMKDVTENVLSETLPDSFIKPYVSNNVNILNGFYSKDDENEKQEKALILYENTYMPSSGIMYESSEPFDVVSVYDGTIKSIREDEILGKVVEINHSEKLTTIYYSLSNVSLNEGDEIKKGTIIGTSGVNKIVGDKNVLYFEVYNNGKLIDPEKFYELNPNEIK